MNRRTVSRSHGLRALGAALAVGIVGALAIGSPAMAAPVPGPITAQNGSITVHKHALPGFGTTQQNPDGSQGTGGSPLQGVGFQVCSIAGIDLIGGGNAAWNDVRAAGTAAAALAAGATTLDGHALTCQPAKTTDATGTAAFTGLPVGAYLVRETTPGTNPIVQPAAPFVVTVPTPAIGAAAGQWLYDVHVYPKNQLAGLPVKNLDDQPGNGVVLGDKIGFTISQKIPALAPGVAYNRFRVLDTLDAALKHTADPITVTSSGTALVAADYTTGWVGARTETLEVTLTAAGLAKIKAGDTITIGFKATSSTNGTFKNTGWVNVNNLTLQGTTTPTPPENPGTNPPPPGNPTNELETRWGAVKLTKVNASGGAGLQGAKFDLFMVNAATCPATLTGGTKVGSYTSDAAGAVSVPGLWVGDTRIVNGSKPYDTTSRCYYLVETAAPAGFVTDGTPRGFVVTPGATAAASATLAVQNSQQLVPGLPLTGSDGQLILTYGGIGLLVLAAGGALFARGRRNKAEAHAEAQA